MKICSKCHKPKDESLFSKDERLKSGIAAHCKKCAYKFVNEWRIENPKKRSSIQERYYLKHKKSLKEKRKTRENNDWDKTIEKRKIYGRRSLLKKYGLTTKDFNHLLDKQGNRCSICKKIFSKIINIDHCHKTGKTRGLLCTGCNVSLGHLEKEGFLEKANEYLSIYNKI